MHCVSQLLIHRRCGKSAGIWSLSWLRNAFVIVMVYLLWQLQHIHKFNRYVLRVSTSRRNVVFIFPPFTVYIHVVHSIGLCCHGCLCERNVKTSVVSQTHLTRGADAVYRTHRDDAENRTVELNSYYMNLQIATEFRFSYIMFGLLVE